MLQDNVPAFSSQAAVATVERGLGKPITEVFRGVRPHTLLLPVAVPPSRTCVRCCRRPAALLMHDSVTVPSNS